MGLTDSIKKLVGGGASRRREARLRVRVPAVVNGVEGRLFDLSLRGCGFYASRSVTDMDKRVEIKLSLRRGETLNLKGKIASKDDDGIVFGVVFTHVPDNAFDAIEDLLSRAKIRPGNIDVE